LQKIKDKFGFQDEQDGTGSPEFHVVNQLYDQTMPIMGYGRKTNMDLKETAARPTDRSSARGDHGQHN